MYNKSSNLLKSKVNSPLNKFLDTHKNTSFVASSNGVISEISLNPKFNFLRCSKDAQSIVLISTISLSYAINLLNSESSAKSSISSIKFSETFKTFSLGRFTYKEISLLCLTICLPKMNSNSLNSCATSPSQVAPLSSNTD